MTHRTALSAVHEMLKGMDRNVQRDLIERSLNSPSIHQMVRTFHDLYGMPNNHKVQKLSRDRLYLRLHLIYEEFVELLEASNAALDPNESLVMQKEHADIVFYTDDPESNQDTIEIADALGDIVYVCFGMAIEAGIDLSTVIREIHAANMTKLGGDGKPIINGMTEGYREGEEKFDPTRPTGKVLKGPDYHPAQLQHFVLMGK